MNRAMADDSSQETPIPISTKRRPESERAMPITTIATAAPPARPRNGRQKACICGKNSSIATTVMTVPSLTPIRPGSARPLRVVDCIAAPAAPSAAPQSRARRMRGRRNWPIMIDSSSFFPDPASQDRTAGTDVGALPIIVAAIAPANRSAARLSSATSTTGR
ncbi:hypothetical protein D3C71_1437590 [compost metagenome]